MKSFYEKEEKVNQYIDMAKGYDGKEIIEKLKNFAKPPKSVLELGMGPGVDLKLLQSAGFQVTGSDYSKLFVARFLETDPKADVLQLDAIHINTERKFDVIYSNKVLHHLTLTELEKSTLRQADVLNDNGIVCHTFWHGDDSYEMEGLDFQEYRIEQLKDIFEMNYEILHAEIYTEMEKDDSILIIGKKVD